MITEERAQLLINALAKKFFAVGERAGLNMRSLAKIASVSPSRASQIKQKAVFNGTTLLCLRDGLRSMEAGLAEGWLPVNATRGAEQEKATERILAR